VAKRVDQAGLTFPVRHIARDFISVDTSGSGGLEHSVDVVDSNHHLIGRLGHPLTVSKLAHDHLGSLPVETELYTMRLANANVLNQPEDLDVPGGCFVHVGHGKHWDYSCPRRRPVRSHAFHAHGQSIALDHIADKRAE
jgi:hypothetical protein